jgi:hypothetical protein
VQISTIPASRTPVNYTGGGSLAGHWGFYQKAESKSKISNVKNCVLIRVYAASCLVTVRRFIFHDG